MAIIEKFDVSMLVFGIVSSAKIYSIVHHLNKKLLTPFQADPNNALGQSNKHFLMYYLCDDLDLGKCYLVDNKGDKGYFYKELKNFDYILICIDNIQALLVEDLIKPIKKNPFVQHITEVDAGILKHPHFYQLHQQNLMMD